MDFGRQRKIHTPMLPLSFHSYTHKTSSALKSDVLGLARLIGWYGPCQISHAVINRFLRKKRWENLSSISLRKNRSKCEWQLCTCGEQEKPRPPTDEHLNRNRGGAISAPLVSLEGKCKINEPLYSEIKAEKVSAGRRSRFFLAPR